MSNKLTFEDWEKMTIEACRRAPCNVICHECNFHQNTKTAWNFAQAQEQKEIKELKKKVEELEKTVSSQTEVINKLENECSFTYKCPVNSNLQKENESLKKKLEKADEVIELIDYQFCASFGDAENIRGAINMARAYLKEINK